MILNLSEYGDLRFRHSTEWGWTGEGAAFHDHHRTGMLAPGVDFMDMGIVTFEVVRL